MLKNYLTIILRTFQKSPMYVFINVAGFSIGILACIMIVRHVTYEKSYDANLGEDIYRIVYSDNDGSSATVSVPAGPLLVDEVSGFEAYSRLMKVGGVVKAGSNTSGHLSDDYIMGDGQIFDMFDIEVIRGNQKSFNRPGTIYLSRSESERLFGSTEVLGRELVLYERNFGQMTLTVGGIFKDWPANSHIHANAIISLTTLNIYNEFIQWAQLGNWGWNSYYTYIAARRIPGEKELQSFVDRHVGKDLRQNENIRLQLQPVASIHTHSSLGDEFKANSNNQLLNFLLVMAFFILMIASVNYVNLTSARSLQRAKEVGIRKNLGANRWQLLSQFNLEALVMISLSLILSVTLYQVVQPIAVDAFGEAFASSYRANELVILGLFFLPVIAWACWQPSWLASAFSTSDIIKGKLGNDPGGRKIRSASVIVQMGVSILLITSVIIIYSQISHMQNIRLGMNIDQLLVVERPKEDVYNYSDAADAFKGSLSQLSNVETVTATGSIPGRGFNWQISAFQIMGRPFDESWKDKDFSVTYIDESFPETYDIPVLAGEVRLVPDDTIYHVAVNESVLDILNFKLPEEAIGRIGKTGNMYFKIDAVLQNYLHNSVKEEVPPAIFIMDENPQYFSIRFHTGVNSMASTADMIEVVRDQFNRHFPDRIFEYFFLDDLFENKFNEEKSFAQLVAVFSILAVVLSCMGLIGLSIYTLERRRKEMGIRKILGASPLVIIRDLSADIIKLVLVAAMPVLPLTYFLAMKWLQFYPEKIGLQWYYGVIAVVMLIILALLSVGSQFYILSRTNPIESIRYE